MENKYKIIVAFENLKELNENNSEQILVRRVPNVGEYIVTQKFGHNIVKKVCSIFIKGHEEYMVII